MRKIGYVIVGFGGIAENRIAKEGFGTDSNRFAGHPTATLVGVTDADTKRKDAALRLGLRWYDSVDAVLEDPRVEAVFFATNNRSHAPLAERALGAGRHCLVEKPISTTLEDARRLQELAQERRLSLTVDHMMTENAYNRRARELVAAGAIGEVNDISLHMEFSYGCTPEEAATWRCADASEIGGPIGDVGSHCLYMAEFLLNSGVKSLSCVYTPRTLTIAVENGAFIQFRLTNEIQGTARVAFNQPRGGLGGTLNNLGYEIYGTKGVLRGYGTLFQLSGHPGEPIPIRLELDRFTETEAVRVDQVDNIYQSVIGRHAESILSDRQLDGSDALHNLELVLACYASADQRGCMIEF
ncbi:MAG: Gfo/Idh/MocA family oxidoreductase [Phycisphaerales bacterium]|nr:MAG: Gfo/Idh/MocA family oxidoreductase [Phycisphaerales bacterium]